jgi:surface carbohydrate biosynthesis protein
MIRKLSLIIKLIFFAKKFFFSPPKKEIVVFDLESKSFTKTIFFESDVEYLPSRLESINLAVLLKCFIKLKFKLIDYYAEYINIVDPKIVVTNIDTSIIYYRLKKKIKAKIVVIQRGYKTYHNDILTTFKEEESKIKNMELSLDMMFVFNKQIEKIFKKFIKSNYSIIGSANNNNFKIKKNTIKDNSLLYVSGYIEKKPNSEMYSGTNVLHKDYEESEKNFLQFLSKYASSRGKKIKVLGKRGITENDTYRDKESKYFKEMLSGVEFDFLGNSSSRPTFELIDKSSIVLGISSCLLYESLSRKNKTLFCGFTPDKYPINSKLFGYLSNFPKEGPFWYTGQDTNIYTKLLDELDKIEIDQWQKILQQYTPEITFYNENNTILKNYFRESGINVQQKK